ncbi:Transmembrane -like protein [Trichinella pseudospiralis]|uniref:Transmembrane-like protein n=1 Tax=Trichinella pseudospiralis TaxID=6337 RepID=A0A0V1FW31_TRIPS|nr:Transmembrane -like protein [Trichinella pseudospiralis]
MCIGEFGPWSCEPPARELCGAWPIWFRVERCSQCRLRPKLATCWNSTKQAFLTGDWNLALCHSISRCACPLGDPAFDNDIQYPVNKKEETTLTLCPAIIHPSMSTSDNLIDKDELSPRRRFVCKSLQKNFNFKCFALSTMIVSCLVAIGWCQLTANALPTVSSVDNSGNDQLQFSIGPCDEGYTFIPMAFAAMLYCLYMMECWHYQSRQNLISKSDIGSLNVYLEKLRAAAPVVWWQAICYHYTRRTRHITRYRNGDAVVANQVYYERINSKTATCGFVYQTCGVRDISKCLINLDRFPVTKVRFTKSFVFTTLQAANEFEEQRARFFHDNETIDDYMEIREGMDLMNVVFKENILVFRNPAQAPWFHSKFAYWLFSTMLLSWPLRVFVDCRTAHVHCQITKLFGTNYLSPTNRYSTALIPGNRARPADTSDASYLVVPSYSEAMLMDLAPGTLMADTWLTGTQSHPLTSLSHKFKRSWNDWRTALRPSTSSLIFARRSRSLTFAKRKSQQLNDLTETDEGDHQSEQRNGRLVSAPRSISYGGALGFSQPTPSGIGPPSILEESVELDEEPPPPYDAAIRCYHFVRDRVWKQCNERSSDEQVLSNQSL